jgi:hypothetical protein
MPVEQHHMGRNECAGGLIEFTQHRSSIPLHPVLVSIS